MRFTIRDLLWLTVAVALGVAWWMDRGRLTPPYDQAIENARAEWKSTENELRLIIELLDAKYSQRRRPGSSG